MDDGQDGRRTGRLKDKLDKWYKTGQMQDRTDAGQCGRKTGRIQERTDAIQDAGKIEQMQDRMDTRQDGC